MAACPLGQHALCWYSGCSRGVRGFAPAVIGWLSYWLLEGSVSKILRHVIRPLNPTAGSTFPSCYLLMAVKTIKCHTTTAFFSKNFLPAKSEPRKPNSAAPRHIQKTNLSNKILVPGLHYFICFSILRNILSPEGNFTLKLIFQINEDACSGPARRRECRISPFSWPGGMTHKRVRHH